MIVKNAASAATLALCLWNSPAFAQQVSPSEAASPSVPPSAAAASSQDTQLDDIVVTAQFRRETTQTVPISVSAIGGDTLTSGNVSSIQDLASQVPSLVVSTSASYGLAPIAIRGIGGPAGGGSLLTDQPVGVYVDGIYVRALGQSVSDFLDVDSIQVLRGPQGTLYGRNSTAGTILIGSKRPSTTEVSGNAFASYASFDQVKLSGAVNVPLVTDRLAARFALGYADGGDWGRNSIDNRRFGGGRSTSGRLSLRYTPSSDLTIDLIGDHATGTDRPATLQLATARLINPIPGLPLQLYGGTPNVRRADYATVRDNRSLQIIGAQFSKTRSDDVTLAGEWRPSERLKLTSLTGYRYFRVNGIQDTTPAITGPLPGTAGAEFWNNLTGVPPLANQAGSLQVNPANGAFVLGYNMSTQRYETISQELRLSSDGGAFKWTLGAYYAHEKVDGSIRIINEQGGPPMLGATGVVPGSAAGLDLGFGTTQTSNVYAAFADGTYDLTDSLSITAGIRYSRDEKTATIRNTVRTLRNSVSPPLNAGTVDSCPSARNDCKVAFSRATPRLVLTYQPDRNHMVYASASQGFTSGGFNNFGDLTGTLADRPLEIASETITNWEIGTKNEFFDRRVRLNLSAFQSDYKNLQVRQAVNTGGVAIINVPKARIRGIELESIFRATSALTLSANGSWLDGTIRSGTLFGYPDNLGTVIIGSNQPPGAINVAGNRLTRAPRWQGSVAANYSQPTGFGSVDATATFRFQSKTYFNEINQATNQFAGEAYQLVDLRVAASFGENRFQIAAFANNVFDKRYATQIIPYFIAPNATLNTPRSIGVSASMKF